MVDFEAIMSLIKNKNFFKFVFYSKQGEVFRADQAKDREGKNSSGLQLI